MVMIAEKHLIYLPKFLEISLILLMAWLISSALMPSNQAPISTKHTIETTTITNQPPKMTSNAAIFGAMHIQQKPQPQAVPNKPSPIQVSPLTIKLLGTIVAGEHSSAIVRLKVGSKQQTFSLHDIVQAGVRLEQVELDAIVVQRNGKSERILMQKSAALHGNGITRAPAPKPPHYQPRQTIHRSYLNRNIRNFPKLLSQARVVPHFNQGKPDGFVINNIVPNSLYQHIGLRNGDIILKVNGQAITSAQQGMQMYQTLQNASSIDLELRRNGATLPIHYQIQ